VAYRLQTERLVQELQRMQLKFGSGHEWTAVTFESTLDRRHFVALCLGEITSAPTLVRVHSCSVLTDILGVVAPGRMACGTALERIETEGRGVLLLVPPMTDLTTELANAGAPTQPSQEDTLRDFGLGAQVLASLGLRQIRLITKRTARIVGLEAFGLEAVEHVD
jgi:3,4-dihydroxy 2-butanone 4-phosphate synthase/GTP cyclohydrolase II